MSKLKRFIGMVLLFGLVTLLLTVSVHADPALDSIYETSTSYTINDIELEHFTVKDKDFGFILGTTLMLEVFADKVSNQNVPEQQLNSFYLNDLAFRGIGIGLDFLVHDVLKIKL